MNYRHAYHAGNFADVFKHIILTLLLKALARKEKGYCYLDTHAGIGQYDLKSTSDFVNKEYINGIDKLLGISRLDEALHDYFACIKAINPKFPTITTYPGSPTFAKYWQRPQDRIICCELHEADYASLHSLFQHDKQVAVHHRDGYQALKAHLPPKERRGLVLIDPPYEKPEEFSNALMHLTQAVKRWETGIFALWYPIKQGSPLLPHCKQLISTINRPCLYTELCIYPDTTSMHLNGSGLFIINPPWQLAQDINRLLPLIWQHLAPNQQGRYLCENLI